jgi:hypothetical protein
LQLFAERDRGGAVLVARLGATAGNISSHLSKLAADGIIGKARYGVGGNVYRALTDEQARV